MAELQPGFEQDGFRYIGGDPGNPRSWEAGGLKIGAIEDGYRYLGGHPGDQSNWQKYTPPSYLRSAAESGARTLVAAGARLLDDANPFTLSEEDAATLFKNDPEGFNRVTEQSASMALSRYANEQTARAKEVMERANPNEKGLISGEALSKLEYATLDPKKAAYLSPTRVAGDVLQSLPTTLALAVSAYFTKGSSTRAFAAAESEALARGATAAEAQAAGRTAAMRAGAATMAKTSAAGEGAVGYAQQMNQAIDEAKDIPKEKYEQSPQYQELLRQGYTPEIARRKLIAETGREAGITAGAVDAGVNLVGGQVFGRIIGEGGKLAPRAAKGFLTEGAEETLQSVGEQAGQNLAVKTHLDPSQNLMEGVGEQAAAGFVVGGVTGGTFAGALGSKQRTNRPPAAPAVEQGPTPEQKLEQAQNVSEMVAAASELADTVDVYLGQKPPAPEPVAPTPVIAPEVPAAPIAPPDMPALRSMADRNAELIGRATAPGLAFDQQSALEQAQTALPEAKPRTTSSRYFDLSPLRDEVQAQGALAVAQATEPASQFQIVTHPLNKQQFAIARLPKAEPAPAPTPVTPEISPAVVQNRIETAELEGRRDRERAADPKLQLVAKTQRMIEERGGVAAPEEAEILRQAGVPKNYDRIDPALARQPSVDERLSAATGIAVGTEAGLGNRPRESTPIDATEQQNRAGDAEMNARIATGQTSPEDTRGQPSAPPVGEVITALAARPETRSAEQQLTLRQAQDRMAPEDFTIASLAATAPFKLDATQRMRLREMRETVAKEQQPKPTSPIIIPSKERDGTQAAEAQPQETEQQEAPAARPDIVEATIEGEAGQRFTVGHGGKMHEAIRVPSYNGGLAPVLKQLARIWRKEVVFFRSTLAADGFVLPSDNRSLYINVDSKMSPLAVFGHELLHQLKRDNPIAYRAIATVVARQATSGVRAAYRKDYGKGASLEEMAADLMGNAFQDPAFLTDVFAEVEKNAPADAAPGIIRKLADAIEKAVNAALKVLQGMPIAKRFNADAMVSDLGAIRAALKTALADYAREQRNPTFAYDKAAQGQQRQDRGVPVIGTEERVLASEARGEEEITASPPRSDIGHKRFSSTGAYVGAPDWVGSSPQQLTVLRGKLRRLALEGESGRYWYEKSSRAVLDLVGGDKSEAEKFVGLLAIYSQGTDVAINAGFALEAYYQWKAGLPIHSGRFPVEQSRKASEWLEQGKDWGGIKVNNFYHDLMEEIDPSKVDDNHATMDMWMAIAFDYGAKILDQGPKYNFAKRETIRLAEEMGWKPHQVQAAIWTAIKSRTEATEQARNARELKLGIAEKNGNAHAVKKDRQYEHFRLAHKMALAAPMTKEEIAARGADFADELLARTAQLSWEATPSVTGGDIPGIHTAPTAQKFEYLAAVMKVLNRDGVDQIAEMVGLHTPPTITGFSAWEGAVGAGAQSFFPVPITGQGKNRAVLQVARDLLGLYAAVKGFVLKQDAVVWHIPVYGDALIRANGFEIRGSRPLTEDEIRLLYDRIHDEFGTWELAPGYTATGARVLNFTDVDNRDFQKRMRSVVDGLPDGFLGGNLRWGSFRSDGDYIGNNWKESPNGEGYRSRIATGGRSDLQRRADSLRADIEAVNADFAQRYGWGGANEIKRSPQRGYEHSEGRRDDSGPAGQGDAGNRQQARGRVDLTGVHYSQEQRRHLSGVFFGTGAKSEEATRVFSSTDTRLKSRLYAYINEGSGTSPEGGVGFHAHQVKFDNLYDFRGDPLNLWRKTDDYNERESLILDTGFDGYYVEKAFGDQGVAVLLGKAATQGVEPEYLGTGAQPGEVQQIERPPKVRTLRDEINDNTSLPAGRMTGGEWKQALAKVLPDVDTAALEDDRTYYKNEMAKAVAPEEITASAQRPFYSALERGVSALNTKAAPAGGWRDAIKGLVAKGLVKQDEVEWSGVNDWLQMQQGKVTRDQVVQYLQQNGVRVEEAMLADGGVSIDERALDMFGQPYDYLEPAQMARVREAQDEEPSGGTKFSTYQLPGGKDYRELLLTLPQDMSSFDVKQTSDGGWRAVSPAGSAYFGNTREQALERAGVNVSAVAFKSSHFDQPNILAHVRFNERESVDGKRVLFIEEIQSDWAQQGRKEGFGPNAQERYQREMDRAVQRFTDAGLSLDRTHGVLYRPDTLRVRKWRTEEYIKPDDLPGELRDYFRSLERLAEASAKAEQELRSRSAPVAPFVSKREFAVFKDGLELDRADKEGKRVRVRYGTLEEAQAAAEKLGGEAKDMGYGENTPSWVALALKRMIRYAAENGFDRVAFINGEQSADRYDLSKQVSRIVWNPETGNLYATPRQGEERIERSGISAEKLPDIIGKEAAERLVSEKARAPNGTHVLKDGDLKVGGEGMKSFYDKIVPGVARDVLKKLGGSMSTAEIEDRSGDPLRFDTRTAKETRPVLKQPAFDITEAMREKVAGGLPLFSAQRLVGESHRNGGYSPEVTEAFKQGGRIVNVPTLEERVKSLRKDLGKKLAQGLVDQFAPLKDLSQKAYTLARLSKGAPGAFEALLHHGKLSLKDGAYDADMSGGFIQRVGIPLHGELEDFLWWIAGHRAERLSQTDREHLFEKRHWEALQTLDQGVTDFDYTLADGRVTRDRTLIFRDALKLYDEFNRNALDMAEQSGLINAKQRAEWEHAMYVPFYRVSDEDGSFLGSKISNGLVRQRAFKQLKGGTDKLNSDLLSNVLQNWAHLIDASAKNRAAVEAMQVMSANKWAVTTEAPEPTAKGKSHVVWVMQDGNRVYYEVDDPFLLTAVTSLEYAGMHNPAMDALTKMKHWLTVGVTASPAFKVRNLIRDSIQSIATGKNLSYNPVTNVAQGMAETDLGGAAANVVRAFTGQRTKDLQVTQDYVSALAAGGLIRFGTMLEGKQSDRVRQLIKSGVKDSHILDSESKVRALYDRYLEPAIAAYNELGNQGEEINRAALFKTLKAKGVAHDEAALLARDLMDFSMQGAWTAVRFFTQIVPFLNARMQGMYKLGRAGMEDPKRMGVVVGATAAMSLLLLGAYGDDDDWKKREDWDRDNFWWFKLGGTAFRIPKPFEIGAIASLAERGVELWSDPEMTGERFRDRVLRIAADQLSISLVPQGVKPVLDLYSNKDSFTGRPIETMGMERLRPDYRFTAQTSLPARALSTAGQTVAETVGANFLSPVQIDHAVRGYFGWLGSFVISGADFASRLPSNEPTRAAPDYWKVATQGFISELPSEQSRYVSHMYEQAKVIEEAMGTYRMLLKTGKAEEAKEFADDNMDKLRRYKIVEKIKAAETKYNERIRMIERSDLDRDEKKRQIAEIRARKDAVARRFGQ